MVNAVTSLVLVFLRDLVPYIVLEIYHPLKRGLLVSLGISASSTFLEEARISSDEQSKGGYTTRKREVFSSLDQRRWVHSL